MSDSHPRPWRVLREEHLQHCRVFDVHVATMESPHTGSAHPFYRIESPAWVNVVALTPQDELVMVRQFRHGPRVVTLEIPGGIVDPGEAPEEAAARELRRAILMARKDELERQMDRVLAAVTRAGSPAPEELATEQGVLAARMSDLQKRLAALDRP